jgi:hypothetical protein
MLPPCPIFRTLTPGPVRGHSSIIEECNMALEIVPLQTVRRVLVRQEFRLQFRVRDTETRQSAEQMGPLRALVFHPAEGWQGQCWARPVDGDLYEVSLPIPVAGDCCLFFSCPGAEKTRPRLRYVIFRPMQQWPQTSTGWGAA